MVHLTPMKHNRINSENDRRQRGATAMLTVIFLALLLSIVTLSFIRLSVTEQRQASDDALTTRAYYAAESGLEDAKRAIQRQFDGDAGNNPVNLNGDVCKPAEITATDPDINADNVAVLSDPLATYYTCQLINMAPFDYQAELDAWGSVTLPLISAGDPIDEVWIEWHQAGPTPFNGAYTLPANGWELYQHDFWVSPPQEYPAILRANFFSTPDSGNLSRSAFTTATGFLRPAGSGSPIPSIYSTGPTGYNKGLFNTNCNPTAPSGEYVCLAVLRGIDNSRRNYLHLNALYRSTNVKIRLIDAANDQQPMQDTQAVIDVTGRAGDVYRRVEARVALTDLYPLPDYAIWANEEICKRFTMSDEPDHYLNECNSWQ